jgi:serine/threonine protein kinase
MTVTGQLMGTIDFMSPEQMRTEESKYIDHRTDIYSLGATLLKLLGGQFTFEKVEGGERIGARMIAVSQGEAIDLESLKGKVNDERILAVIEKATTVKREERYQSGKEMRDALLEIADNPQASTKSIDATQITETLDGSGVQHGNEETTD